MQPFSSQIGLQTFTYYMYERPLHAHDKIISIRVMSTEEQTPYCFYVTDKNEADFVFYSADRGDQRKGDCLVFTANGQHPMSQDEFELAYTVLLAWYPRVILEAKLNSAQEKVCKAILDVKHLFQRFCETPHIYFSQDGLPACLYVKGDAHDTGSYLVLLQEGQVLKHLHKTSNVRGQMPATGLEVKKVVERIQASLASCIEKYTLTQPQVGFLQTKLETIKKRYAATIPAVLSRNTFEVKNEAYVAPEIAIAKNIILADVETRYFCLGYPPEFFIETKEGKLLPMDKDHFKMFCDLLTLAGKIHERNCADGLYKLFCEAKELSQKGTALKV